MKINKMSGLYIVLFNKEILYIYFKDLRMEYLTSNFKK